MPRSQDLHHQAAEFREAGQFEDALSLVALALVAAIREANSAQIAELHLELVLLYKHLWVREQHDGYLQLAEQFLVTAQRFAASEQWHQIAFWQGQIAGLQQHWSDAQTAYQQATMQLSSGGAVTANYRAHWGQALFLAGKQQEGQNVLSQAITELRQHANEPDEYTWKVWLSGAYLRQAGVLASLEYLSQATQSLDQAAAVIASDDRLQLRQGHLESARQKLRQGTLAADAIL